MSCESSTSELLSLFPFAIADYFLPYSYDDVVGPVPPPQQEGEEEPKFAMENYETIYALLSARSSGFRHRFSERLAQRLSQLQEQQLLEENYEAEEAEEKEEGGGK